MSTDRDEVKALLTRLGIPFSEKAKVGEAEIKNTIRIRAESKNVTPKVDGYCCFLTDFEFDDAGTFVKIGLWE